MICRTLRYSDPQTFASFFSGSLDRARCKQAIAVIGSADDQITVSENESVAARRNERLQNWSMWK